MYLRTLLCDDFRPRTLKYFSKKNLSGKNKRIFRAKIGSSSVLAALTNGGEDS